jgi:hypothetical protein
LPRGYPMERHRLSQSINHRHLRPERWAKLIPWPSFAIKPADQQFTRYSRWPDLRLFPMIGGRRPGSLVPRSVGLFECQTFSLSPPRFIESRLMT